MNDYLHKEHPELMDFDYSVDNKEPVPEEFKTMTKQPHLRNPYEIGSAQYYK